MRSAGAPAVCKLRSGGEPHTQKQPCIELREGSQRVTEGLSRKLTPTECRLQKEGGHGSTEAQNLATERPSSNVRSAWSAGHPGQHPSPHLASASPPGKGSCDNHPAGSPALNDQYLSSAAGASTAMLLHLPGPFSQEAERFEKLRRHAPPRGVRRDPGGAHLNAASPVSSHVTLGTSASRRGAPQVQNGSNSPPHTHTQGCSGLETEPRQLFHGAWRY